jgi:hypothetical protein
MVTCLSLATRRKSAAKVAGIVTLCRTDRAGAAFLFVPMFLEYQECTRVVHGFPEQVKQDSDTARFTAV